MDQIPRSARPLPYAKALLPDPNRPGEVRRQIAIDGANVINATAVDRREKLPLLGLLSLMRQLIMHDFEIVVLLGPKYVNPNVIILKSLQRFIELEEFFIIDTGAQHVLDDEMMLEFANSTGGVVLSNDRFRDHMKKSERYATIVPASTAQLEYQIAPPEMRRSMTTDGHYVEYHYFKFPPHEKLWTSPIAMSHEIAVESYSYWSPERKAAILEQIDDMLVEMRRFEERPY